MSGDEAIPVELPLGTCPISTTFRWNLPGGEQYEVEYETLIVEVDYGQRRDEVTRGYATFRLTLVERPRRVAVAVVKS